MREGPRKHGTQREKLSGRAYFVVSVGFCTTTVAGGAVSPGPLSVPWMASYPSCRWTGTSLGATIPSRTLSPRISTTVTVMSLLITILSFFFLDSTSIVLYPFQRQWPFQWLLAPTRSGVPLDGR